MYFCELAGPPDKLLHAKLGVGLWSATESTYINAFVTRRGLDSRSQYVNPGLEHYI